MANLKPGNEQEPSSKVPILHHPPDSLIHYVSDGENWHSVARQYERDVNALIKANFGTLNPKEINWYLNHYVCCDKTTPDGHNWSFSSSARQQTSKSPRAGIIYIPPKELVFDDGDTIEAEQLLFDGQKLRWLRGGRTIASWPAVSGKEGYQKKGYQSVSDKGPIPEGLWEVRQSEYQRMPDRGIAEALLAEVGGSAWPWGESAWGQHRIWLHPAPGTNTLNRSGFSIHGGDEPGSAGCIDLTSNMPYFVERFRTYGRDLRLRVKY